jgi:hypothetical protein
METSEFRLDKPFAEIQEAKELAEPNRDEVRVYCAQYDAKDPNNSTYNLQIRTHKGIGWPCGKGKPRDMIATVGLTVREIETIAAHMRKYNSRYV